jgi:hypothetical protein
VTKDAIETAVKPFDECKTSNFNMPRWRIMVLAVGLSSVERVKAGDRDLLYGAILRSVYGGKRP